tara:strand:- start:5177 stop:5602 length:426 start_codon:yes stop_codon:yes gene_type:complete
MGYFINCHVSGEFISTREVYVKDDNGVALVFENMDEAEEEAAVLNNKMNHPKSLVKFLYTAEDDFGEATKPQTKPVMILGAVSMTSEQYSKVLEKYQQSQNDMSLEAFVKSAMSIFACDGAIALPWCGMVLCIERDGYCHT